MSTRKRFPCFFIILSLFWIPNILNCLEIPFYWLDENKSEIEEAKEKENLLEDQAINEEDLMTEEELGYLLPDVLEGPSLKSKEKTSSSHPVKSEPVEESIVSLKIQKDPLPLETEKIKKIEDPFANTESEDLLLESNDLLLDSDLLLIETEKLLSENSEKTPLEQKKKSDPANNPSNASSKQALVQKTDSHSKKKELPTKETAEADSESSLYEDTLFFETEWPDISSEVKERQKTTNKNTTIEKRLLTPKFTVLENKATTKILTHSLKDRETLKLRLTNDLSVYIISDPKTDKSGASLSIQAGSWQDPEEFPGLAHFVEHMLFLGTSKFPEESGFKEFVQNNNGLTNAYTTGDHTNYGFVVNNGAFNEGLERFSWLFIDPLFKESSMDRELKAIDQEFARVLENERVRSLFVHKELGNKYHPETRFSYGNLATLQKIKQKKAKEWFDTYYSSNLMNLVIHTPLPIEEARDLAVRLFTPVKNTQAQAISPQTTLTSPTYDANIVYITPLKDMRKLSLQWELSTEFAYDRENKTMNIIAHVLGHEGEKSLLAQLKREELAEGLSSGGSLIGPNNALFNMDIELTSKGMENLNTVIARCFQAISYFKNNGIPPYIFDEVKTMALNRYQYQSRKNTFDELMQHSRNLTEEKLETYPEKTYLYKNFNPRKARRLLSELSTDHCHMTVTALPEFSHIKPDRIEKWMGVEYAVLPIPERTLAEWYDLAPNSNIDTPAPNPFIPENLRIVNRSSNELKPPPIAIFDESIGKIYFSSDTEYLAPEISWHFNIITPEVDNKSENRTLGELYLKSVIEKLNSIRYQASLAGLESNINLSYTGIEINLSGYSEKAGTYFQEILNVLKTATPTESQFDIYKNSLKRSYENALKESPLELSNEILRSIIFENYATAKEKAEIISNISYEDLLAFHNKIFQKVYVEGLLYGNMVASEAREIWNRMLSSLTKTPYPQNMQRKKKALVLPQSVGPFYLVDKTDRQGNAVLLMLQNAPFSWKNRAAQQILSKGMKEPFFTMLRTKQQTGYLVWNWEQEIERQLYSFFAVQSNTHNVRDLLARFELFFESFLQEFTSTEFPEKRFEKLKEALTAELKQPCKNLQEKGNLLNKLAFEYNGDFDWIRKRIQGFEELTYLEFLDLSKSFIGRENKQRLAILMKGHLPEEKSFRYYRVNTSQKMRMISEYSSKEEIR